MNQMDQEPLWSAETAAALTTAWAGRGAVDYAPETPSTNTRLKEMLREGASRGSMALCDLQTAGRGRIGRPWVVNRGEALTLSLLLQPRLPVEKMQLCTLATALAVTRAIRDAAPTLHPGVKWPNDVVLSHRKCTGILSELELLPGQPPAVVMGVGVNVNQTAFSPELAATATSLLLEIRRADPMAGPLSLRELLVSFLRREEEAMDALEQGGFPALLPQYRDSSVTLGRQVRVLGPKTAFTGLAEDVDPEGALLVRDESGSLRRVLCGDVSVRGLMGYSD